MIITYLLTDQFCHIHNNNNCFTSFFQVTRVGQLQNRLASSGSRLVAGTLSLCDSSWPTAATQMCENTQYSSRTIKPEPSHCTGAWDRLTVCWLTHCGAGFIL